MFFTSFSSLSMVSQNYRTIMRSKLFTACLSAALLFPLLNAPAGEKEKNKTAVDISKLPPASDQKDVTYVKDIKPIFDHSCIKCHGPEKQKGKLRLDTLPAALKGGQDGK